MWVSYKEKIKTLSDRIVEAQKPIRVLDSVKWDTKIEEEFFAAKGKSLPNVNADTYKRVSLGFDPSKKIAELDEIGADIDRTLGVTDDIGRILKSMTEEYADLARMLGARGTKEFYEYSKKLYGSPKDRFYNDTITISEQGKQLYGLLGPLDNKFLGHDYPKILTSEQVVTELQRRFKTSFLGGMIDVKMSDGIVADAAAGSDVIKIREGAMFSEKDISIFEVHEGWVHVATSLNGKAQKVASFLSKGPPRCVATQEGLAILMEILTFSTYPLRARAINDRILGVDKAEDGAYVLVRNGVL
jgi:uncharacterized protein (TIGR02421 family)